MQKINSMTAVQWQQAYEMRQSIYDLCASPTDRVLAKQAVDILYSLSEKVAPKVIFAKSPLEGLLFAVMLQTKDFWANLRANLGANLWANLRANLRDNLGDNLWDNLGANLRANLWANLGANLRANLRDNLGDNLWDNLGANLRANLGANLRANLGANLGDFYYQKSYLGFLMGGEIAGIIYDKEKWDTYKFICKSLDVIIPFEDLCIVCDRPIKIGWHDAGGIHCEDGPAVEYTDGYSLWALEGYAVPKELVLEAEKQTIEDIRSEENEEIRRIRINRFGWSRYISESGGKVLDVSMPCYGGMESLIETSYGSVLCTYDPSTGKPFALEVPISVKTCEQAQRYLLAPEVAFGRHGVNVDEIKTYPPIRA